MDSKKLKKILKEAYNVGVLKSGGEVKTTYINNRTTFEEWYESKVKNNDSLHDVSNRDVFSDLRQLGLSSEQCSIVGAYIKSL